jgi:hypothetical protein
MPPAGNEKKKGADNRFLDSPVVLPIFPRRNYHLRTYSGANLSKSDKIDGIQRKVFKNTQLLMWDNLGKVVALPELSKLDFRLETKILDLIFGEDPLNEGTTTIEYNKKVALQAERNLQEAMNFANKKISLLLEKWVVF